MRWMSTAFGLLARPQTKRLTSFNEFLLARLDKLAIFLCNQTIPNS